MKTPASSGCMIAEMRLLPIFPTIKLTVIDVDLFILKDVFEGLGPAYNHRLFFIVMLFKVLGDEQGALRAQADRCGEKRLPDPFVARTGLGVIPVFFNRLRLHIS